MSNDEWEDEWPIIKRIADRYKNCSITISEQPEFAVVEAVLRCAAEEGLVLVASKQNTCICHADSPWLCPVHAPINGRETKQ